MCSPTSVAMSNVDEDFMMVMKALAQPEPQHKRRVSFAPMVACSEPNPLALEDVRGQWYSPQELLAFKQLAKKSLRTNNGEMRGLEHHTPLRKKRRYMAIRCVTSAYRSGMDTAAIASQCNEWSSELAFYQACHDYADVYAPRLNVLIPAARPAPAFPSVSITCKRSLCDDDSGSRRLRRRVSSVL